MTDNKRIAELTALARRLRDHAEMENIAARPMAVDMRLTAQAISLLLAHLNGTSK
jgi:hypothetical protein